MLHALHYSYRHRRERKGDFRRLWNVRINAAARAGGLTYSQFIAGLRRSNVEINRKMLAEMAVKDPEGFATLVASVTETNLPPSTDDKKHKEWRPVSVQHPYLCRIKAVNAGTTQAA